jgi:hypothetical protein
MTAPTNKVDGAMMTDEQIDALVPQYFGADRFNFGPSRYREFARALLSASKPAVPQTWLNDEQAEGDAKAAELSKMLANIIHDQTVAMQSAIIEWQHGKGAEAGFSWIVNTLEGPGHLPDFDAPYGKQAQFWFDANRAEPFPKCFCGNPSHQLWMGQGFCCNEHYAEAKAQHDAAPAASTSDQS